MMRRRPNITFDRTAGYIIRSPRPVNVRVVPTKENGQFTDDPE
jgi:hypothetical protein